MCYEVALSASLQSLQWLSISLALAIRASEEVNMHLLKAVAGLTRVGDGQLEESKADAAPASRTGPAGGTEGWLRAGDQP